MKTIHQIFDDYETALEALDELQRAGFSEEQVSLLSGGRTRNMEAGAAAGAFVGGGAGLLAGLGILAIPGIVPIWTIGVLATAIAGGAVGAVAGGLAGAMIRTGIPENDAHRYAETIRRGGGLIVARVSDRDARRVHEVLDRHRPPKDSNEAETSKASGWSRLEERVRSGPD